MRREANAGFLAALVGLGAFLAGCAGEACTVENGCRQPEVVGEEGRGRLEIPAPNWTVGEWWVFTGSDGIDYSYVVTEDQGADWWVDTANEGFAFHDALEDSSYVGLVRKSDLAGSQGDDRVNHFEFPLYEGRNWTTKWDGMDLTVSATVQDAAKATLEATRPTGVPYARYTFDAAVGWFGEGIFFDEGGNETFRGRTTGWGSNYTGDVYRWTLGLVINNQWTSNVAQPSNPFTVEETVTDLWMSFEIRCPGSSVGWAIVVKPTSPEPGQASAVPDQGYSSNGPCTSPVSLEYVIEDDPLPGQWNAALSWGDAQNTAVSRLVLAKRTLQTIPFPAA